MNEELPMEPLEPIAEEIIASLGFITDAAMAELRGMSSGRGDVFANTSNSSFTAANSASVILDQGNRTQRESNELLKREPAIARVVANDGTSDHISYICRATPPIKAGMLDLVSQRAPKGRLASLPIGAALQLPNGRTLTVLSRTELHPMESPDGWDSHRSVFRGSLARPVTIESLRSLLSNVTATSAHDFLSLLLAEESQKDLVTEGSKRSVLTSMQLRDQAILDSHQDEIFRLPLNEHIFLAGPPGTGKTTTLIRRLGQKLDLTYLTEEERKRVDRADASGSVAHADSWLMFTPTELLRQYVKEAFSRERIPASDLRIKTWEEYRREIARNNFKILRSASKRSFVLRTDASITSPAADEDQKSFYDDFDVWQRQTFLNQLSRAATGLRESQNVTASSLGTRVGRFIERTDINSFADLFIAIAAMEDELRSIVDELRKSIELPIKGALNQRLNKDRLFVTKLSTSLQTFSGLDDPDQDDGSEDEDEDEDDETTSGSGIALAVKAYMAAQKALARARFTNKKVTATSRNGKVLDVIGSNDLDPDTLKTIGRNLNALVNARTLLSPAASFVFGTTKRYRIYRRKEQREGRWYHREVVFSQDVNELELDVLFLATLRAARDLLVRAEIRDNIDERPWSNLEPILDLYRNQILVDEATDFSPIQLACMVALVHPNTKSFFASGDFNQRLTEHGIGSADELAWISSSLRLHEVDVLFRQSRRLQSLSKAMLESFDGENISEGRPGDAHGSEFAPVLLENHGTTQQLAEWLAKRVQEIETILGQLPSIAVFVSSEVEVEPLTLALNEVLADNNLHAVACVRGLVKGQENDIRVFDIQHVKGLEFEAVFFVGVDLLAKQLPETFVRYLYVGATRAATYLGVSCEKQLPSQIAHLRSFFTDYWPLYAVQSLSLQQP